MEGIAGFLYNGMSAGELLIFYLLAMIVGMSKAGLSGFGLVAIPSMALIFGARESTGILLPILLTGDIMAVIYYHRSAVWKHILKVLPWAGAGIAAALITGNLINPGQFKIILTAVVIVMLILMVVNDLWKKPEDHVPHNRIFPVLMGLAGGFATMIGNSAGPVFTAYFLSVRLPKKEFIGTAAWLFLIMNAGKMPLHIFVWGTISSSTLPLSLSAIPFVAAGIWLGIVSVKLFSEKGYRLFVIVATVLTSVLLFL